MFRLISTLFLFCFLFVAIHGFSLPPDSMVVGKIKNGKHVGNWRYYNTNMKVIKIVKYRHGGIYRTYIFNEKGQAIQRINRRGVVTKLRACGC